jgi:hypothetical protein
MTENVSSQLRSMIRYTGEGGIIPLKQLLVVDLGLPIPDDQLMSQAADLIGAAFKPIFPGIEIDIRGRDTNLYLKGFERIGERPAPAARRAGSDASSVSSWGRLKEKFVAYARNVKEEAARLDCLPEFKYFEKRAAQVGRKMKNRAESVSIDAQEFYENYVEKFGEPPG